jgi:L-alanine-DL-glutamate epimerase-like enolase superfamily enzyme
MKITEIECLVLLAEGYRSEACDSSQDDLVVRIHTDEGLVGIGEVDTNPWVAKAMIEAPGTHIMGLGIKELLIGEDPIQIETLWEKMYVFTAMTGRRGLGICAIGAIDMALWDLRGKALGEPIWKLLGGAQQPHITPYASLLPEGTTLQQYQDSLISKAILAKDLGFPAAKLEICIKGPYTHNALREGDQSIVEIVSACREAVGTEMTIMVDVAYCWRDWKAAIKVIKAIEPYDIFFIETPLPSDDLDGYRQLAAASPIRIAAGEWLNTRWEFLDLMDRGGVDVAQPDVGRVGGLTEALRVARAAKDRGKLIVPHCWKTGIGVAASAHLAAASSNCRFIEYLPSDVAFSPLRRELVQDELRLVDGNIPLPRKPGLGVELDEDALQKFRVDNKSTEQLEKYRYKVDTLALY